MISPLLLLLLALLVPQRRLPLPPLVEVVLAAEAVLVEVGVVLAAEAQVAAVLVEVGVVLAAEAQVAEAQVEKQRLPAQELYSPLLARLPA